MGKKKVERAAPAKQAARKNTVRVGSRKARGDAHELKEALAEASGTRSRRKGKGAGARQLSAKERSQLRGVVIYLDDEARKQLARLAVDEGRTTQDLGVEAINLLFQLYRVGAIA